MKKLFVILAFISLFIAKTNGQINLMPNGDFSSRHSCSSFGGRCVTNILNWQSPTDGSPDWMDSTCYGTSGNFGVPQNYAGWQYARTGVSYAGLSFDASSSLIYREYITGTLSDSLMLNKKYCVEFFVSLADSLWWASSAIGAYFSDTTICVPSSQTVLPFIPQIENPLTNFIKDKINWVPVSGEFQASGGEHFITLGNFYDSASYFDSNGVGNGGLIWDAPFPSAYYYIDDVSVRELTIANAAVSASTYNQKIDTICPFNSVQIGKDTTTPGVSFHWLPNYNLNNANIAQPWASPSVTTTYTLTVINDSVHGCNCADSVTKDSVKIVVNLCTGIQELKNAMNIRVSLNPTNGNFILSMNSISDKPEIEVYNVFGQLIERQKITSLQTNINISSQPDGVYFYRVLKSDDGFLWSGKLIVE